MLVKLSSKPSQVRVTPALADMQQPISSLGKLSSYNQLFPFGLDVLSFRVTVRFIISPDLDESGSTQK